MTGHRQYKITDYRFGQMLLGLREKVGLTQIEVADALNISRRTIQHWEAGTGFPDTLHFKNLIEYYLKSGAFTSGFEKEEARTLWAQADDSASRRKTIFDERWFDSLHKPAEESKQTIIPTMEKTGKPASVKIDWGEAPEITHLYGREKELALLQEWVLNEKCRLVTILGMGGIGKSAMVTKFAEDASSHFDFIIWRSLRNATSLDDLLSECFQILPPIKNSNPTLHNLIELFQQNKCLLILDNVETLHRSGKLAGMFREGFEEYQKFFQTIAQTRHQSCLILTSREKLIDLEAIEGPHSPVHLLKLNGISSTASQEMLIDRGLYGSSGTWDVFVHYYTGNPLALKIAGASVRDLFGGDLATFLREAPVTLHTLNQLLGNQFEQLSELERDILFWMAIERDPVDINTLRLNFLLETSNHGILAALMSLIQRSLIERSDQGAVFYLLPVLVEFLTDRLVTTVVDQITQKNIEMINKYALVKSQSIDQIRDSQIRMIIHPVIALLKRNLGNQHAVAELLRELVQKVRGIPREEQGYAGGNLANLMVHLDGHLKNQDFTNLTFRQLYLQGIEAQDTDFSNAQFFDSRFTEPLETISAMTLSPSGNLLAASTYNGHIRCWNVSDGKPVWTVTNANRAWSLKFSPDEKLLACSHFRGRVSVWDASAGRCLHIFEGEDAWVHTLDFDPSSRYIATAGADTKLSIWDIQNKMLYKQLSGHSSRIWSIAYSPDGNFIVSSGDEDAIMIWDVNEGKLLRKIKQASKGIFYVAFHPNGKVIASCCDHDPRINIWDCSTGDFITSLSSNNRGLASLAFNPDGSLLASGNLEGSVEIWDISNFSQAYILKRLMGHHHYVGVIALSRQDYLATLSYGENIKLWNLESGKLIRVVEGYSRMIGANTFSPNANLLLQGDASGRVRIFDMEKMAYTSTFQAHTGPIWATAFNPEGTVFATAGDDRIVRIWDLVTLNCVKSFEGHAGQIWCLAFNHDGSLLASGGSPNTIILWDASQNPNNNPVTFFEAEADTWSLQFTADSSILFSGHTDGKINAWDMTTRERKITLQHGTVPIGDIQISKDELNLITTSNQVLMKTWDIHTYECINSIEISVEGNRTKAAGIGRSGKMIATGSGGQIVNVWEISETADTPDQVTFAGHTSRVWGLALSPDEHFLATSDEEGTTMIIDLVEAAVIKKVLIDRPYERMNIRGVSGLNTAERSALKALGAVETGNKVRNEQPS